MSTKDLTEHLPTDERIEKLYNIAIRRISEWDPKAAITKIQFGIAINASEVNWNFLTEAESSWKKYKTQFVTYDGSDYKGVDKKDFRSLQRDDSKAKLSSTGAK